MLAAAALLASIVIGPEITIPTTPSVPAPTNYVRVAALANGDFLVLAVNHVVSALKIDGITGKPARTTATPITDDLQIPGLWANGDHALAVWLNTTGFAWVVLDHDAQPVARASIAIPNFAYGNAQWWDVTPLADGYLIAWAESSRVLGIFIDGNGAQRGGISLLVPESRSRLALATNGTTALLAAVNPAGQIVTAIITASGRVTPGGIVAEQGTFLAGAAWDGAGYVLAWMSPQYFNSDLWLGWTDPAGHSVAPPLRYATATWTPLLVSSGDGAALFFRTLDGRDVVARLGHGGAVLDSTPYPLPVAFGPPFDPNIAVASNGHAYAVIRDGALMGGVTDLVTPATAIPIALAAPEQSEPDVAAGDHQAFVTWRGSGAQIARFHDGAFAEPATIKSTGAIIADGDRATTVYWNSGAEAQFVDENGQVAGTLRVGDISGESIEGFAGGSRLPDGSFHALMLVRNGDNYEAWHAVFGRDSVSRFDRFFQYLPDYANAGSLSIDGTSVAWVDDRGRTWAARYDDVGKRLGPAIEVDDVDGDFVVIAEDGAGRALVVVQKQYSDAREVKLIDFATRTIVRTVTILPMRSPAVAWTGSGYLLAAGKLDLLEIASDATAGSMTHIAVPYGMTSAPQIAHGAAGTFLVYTRPAFDLGLGDASRLFIRTITPPHHRAGGK